VGLFSMVGIWCPRRSAGTLFRKIRNQAREKILKNANYRLRSRIGLQELDSPTEGERNKNKEAKEGVMPDVETVPGERIRSRFRLNVVCQNCRRAYACDLAVPDEDDAPSTIDDLVESAFLAQQRFICPKCESAIGLVTAIRQVGEE